MKDYEDVQLIEEHRHGNRQAFNEIVRRYQERVYWVVRRIVMNHEDALDLSQDVFVRAFQGLDSFRGDSQMFTWLYKIAMNLSLNHVRKCKLRSFFHVDDYINTISDKEQLPDSRMETDETRSILERAIETLPNKQKAVFLMRYYDEMPYEQIAKVMNRTTGALKANYFHAMQKIEVFFRNEM